MARGYRGKKYDPFDFYMAKKWHVTVRTAHNRIQRGSHRNA